MTKFINNTAKVFFVFILSIITFGVTRTLVAAPLGYAWYSYIAALLFLAGIFVLMVGTSNRAEKLYNKTGSCFRNLSARKLALILGGVCLVTKIAGVLIFNCDCNLHPDMSQYISFADQISHFGRVTEGVDYAIAHSYTLFYGIILSPIGLISGSNPLGYTLVMSVITTITMVLLFDILAKYAGKATAFIGLLIYNLLPMGFFQSQVVIHETALLFFHVLSFWLLLKVFDSNRKIAIRIIYATVSLLLMLIGACINEAGMVILISFAIFATAKIISSKAISISNVKNFLFKGLSILFVVVVIVGCILSTGAIKSACVDMFVEKTQTQSIRKSLPYGWGLYLGANYENSGAWNKEDKETYYKYKEIEDRDEALEYQRNLITERFSKYLENPLRIPVHIYKKIVVLWSPYFTFRNVSNSPSYEAMSSFAGGMVKKGLIMLTHLGYLLFYFMTLIGAFRNKKYPADKVTPALHFMLVVVGLTLALLPFEIMAKYSSHAQILIFAVGIMNFSTYRNNLLSITKHLAKKR